MQELQSLKDAIWEAENNPYEFNKRKKQYLLAYYRERKKYEHSFLANITLSQRKRIHNALLSAIKINNRLNGRKYELLFDKRCSTKRSKIFAVTHVGRYDIEMVSGAVKDHFYLFTNGFEGLHNTIDEVVLALNGVIYFNHIVKKDRQIAAERAVKVLKKGGNIMIFPEGAYNITPNVPVMPLNWGIIDIAYRSGAEIVPVAVERYGNRYKICIGSFDYQIIGNSTSEKVIAISKLRDKLAEMKWDIWRSEPKLKHKAAKLFDWEKHITAALAGGDDTADDCERERFHPKNVTTYNEAFFHLSEIVPNHNTAFLFNKRIN